MVCFFLLKRKFTIDTLKHPEEGHERGIFVLDLSKVIKLLDMIVVYANTITVQINTELQLRNG